MTLIEKGNKNIIGTYNRFPIVLESGKGVYLFDNEGKKYLDFVAGIAVNALGYSNEEYNNVIKYQVDKLCHVSNLYWTEPNVELAEILVENSDFDQVFFCNSGTEAVEAALKVAKLYGNKFKNNATEIIAMNQSFHGRTLGALSVTGQRKYQDGFEPLIPNINFVDYNDFEQLSQAVNNDTCAIILEVIQGEGGINSGEIEYFKKVRKLCDEQDIVLIFDEVQTGIGRTGKLFAYQLIDVVPDIVTMAKGLGGGFPIGGILAKNKFADVLVPGTHASTFGGNPLASAAAKCVLQTLIEGNLLKNVEETGKYLTEQLQILQEKYSSIKEIKGVGLIQGIKFSDKIVISDIVNKAMEKGLLIIPAGSNVIRIVPPLIITKSEIDEGLNIIEECIE
jgi:predicted acetylornithine/succinylornithine family transaminase